MQSNIDSNHYQTETLPDHLLKEFQQGNFSNLRDTKLSSEKIVEILLQHPETSQEQKIEILKHMISKCATKTEDIFQNEEQIIEKIREHNDKVRETLKILFQSTNPEILKER